MTDQREAVDRDPIGTMRRVPAHPLVAGSQDATFIKSAIGWVCIEAEQWRGAGHLRMLHDHEMDIGPSEVIGIVPGSPADHVVNPTVPEVDDA